MDRPRNVERHCPSYCSWHAAKHSCTSVVRSLAPLWLRPIGVCSCVQKLGTALDRLESGHGEPVTPIVAS